MNELDMVRNFVRAKAFNDDGAGFYGICFYVTTTKTLGGIDLKINDTIATNIS